jgi:hypothetical protein
MAQIDLRRATIRIADGGTNYIDVKIGEGTCDYNEKREIEAVKSRGVLDTFRQNEDVPMDVSMNFIWEYIQGSGGATTVEDALKRVGGASSWASVVNPASDPDCPYCVRIIISYIPPCTGTNVIETITLNQFHYTDLAHSLKDGTVALRGMCNATKAVAVRS